MKFNVIENCMKLGSALNISWMISFCCLTWEIAFSRMVFFAETCLAMGKLIDDELKDLDKQHLELTLLNEKILESLRLYDA